MGDLLTGALLSYLSGQEDYADIALFARHRAREFGLFPYTNKEPSSDTFERLFAVLKTDCVERAVVEQGRRILDTMNEKQIAVDGKKLCWTPLRNGDKRETVSFMPLWQRIHFS